MYNVYIVQQCARGQPVTDMTMACCQQFFSLTRFHILIVLQHIQINGHQYFSFSLLRIDNTNSYIECTMAGDPLAEEVTTMNYGKYNIGQWALANLNLIRTMLLDVLFIKDHSLTM